MPVAERGTRIEMKNPIKKLLYSGLNYGRSSKTERSE